MNELSQGHRGWVKGFSMWPNLIPGDILKAEECQIRDLKSGMIAVFPNEGRERFVVHRVVSVRDQSGMTLVIAAGDRSGVNDDDRNLKSSKMIRIVTGVLRRGKYRSVTRFSFPVLLSPAPVIRFYCTIVRKLFW